MSLVASLAYLTADLPGVGGTIKQRPEDFLVEEQPLYDLEGDGEHLFLFVEKTGMPTTDVTRRLAKAFRVGRGEVGFAGMKDKHAITRQHFSVRLTDAGATPEQALAELEHHPKLKVLWVDRHRNKLRRGHLAGNRFVIRIRDVEPTAVLRVRPILDRLAVTGVPNYIGEQRFGYRQNNHLLGRHLLLGEHQAFLDEMLGRPQPHESEAVRLGREAYDRSDYEAALAHWPRQLRHDRQALDALRQGKSPERAVAAIDWLQREFVVAALQSAIFNRVLHRRIAELGAMDRLLPGDLAWKHDSRAVFAVDEATAEQENGPEGRVRRLAVSPSGPMWGRGMTHAEGEPGRMEREALAELGLTESQITEAGALTPEGSRRPLRVPLRDPDLSGGVDEHGPFVRVAFELPRGAFATVVLREIMKNDRALVTDEADVSE